MNKKIPFQVAFLTGQSDSGRWALSEDQMRFLDALALPSEAIVRINFPYRPDTPLYKPTPLWRASLNNGWMYLRATTPAFIDEYCADMSTLLSRAEFTFFIASSCGLELMRALETKVDDVACMSILALGPVARGLPSCDTILVQGNRDWLSRRYFREIDYAVDCGHMGYLQCPEVLALCQKEVDRHLRAFK